jgi:hypothetical protein
MISNNELLHLMFEYADSNPTQRRGQAYFNCLDKHASELAHSVTGTDFDPFYDDKKINSFLTYVMEMTA